MGRGVGARVRIPMGWGTPPVLGFSWVGVPDLRLGRIGDVFVRIEDLVQGLGFL